MSQPTRIETPERNGTMIETDEDVRQALLAGLPGQIARGAVPPSQAQPGGRPASPFRPTSRPPVPVLTVCDDGKQDGETIRLRDRRFVIGRNEGDFRLPLDGRVSGKHVEIAYQQVGGIHRWVVTDLQSTHGMFVRVSKTPLSDGAEFLVGGGRYRFESSRDEAPARDVTADHKPAAKDFGSTQGWADDAAMPRPPALTELIGREIGNRVLLVKPEYWIGSDPTCAICRPDDPYCDPKHARLSRGPKGWRVEHDRSVNGLWLRMTQIAVESALHFQIGEQQFRLKVQ